MYADDYGYDEEVASEFWGKTEVSEFGISHGKGFAREKSRKIKINMQSTGM